MMHSLTLSEELLLEGSSYSCEDLTLLNKRPLPRHIAIIMDGNRRWAKMRGLPSAVGHWKGADTLTKIVKAAAELDIKILTVYSFSTENWGRSSEEVDALMYLFQIYLKKQRNPMVKEGVRLKTIGDLSAMPQSVITELELSKAATENCKKIDLVLAINYGGRDDIRRAFIRMVVDYENGKLSKNDFSEQMIGCYLDTSSLPDPEVIVRVGGEKRQSNFLLWQSSYSEFYHTDVLWPDFDEKELLKVVQAYQQRERRLGG